MNPYLLEARVQRVERAHEYELRVEGPRDLLQDEGARAHAQARLGAVAVVVLHG